MESRGRRRAGALAIVVACAGALFFVSPAGAEPPAELWTRCDGPPPERDPQCSIPRGIAADPASGHVFVADQVNRRISEFTARGQFVKTWGWDVVQSGPGDDTLAPEDQFEICVPEDGDVCKAGSQGSGAGQFGTPVGVALDSEGSVFVTDKTLNRRVQKFSPDGDFIFTFGADVNKTKVEEAAAENERNLCPIDPGDICQGGVPGTGEGEFTWPESGSFIAIDTAGTESSADDKVWVGDKERIQRFGAEGNYVEDWADSGGVLTGRTVSSLAVDSDGDLYAIYGGNAVHKLDPGGEELEPSFSLFDPNENPVSPTAVAVDASGGVYAFGPVKYGGGFEMDPIFRFDGAGNLVEQFGIGEFAGSTGLATNLCPGGEEPGNLYVSNSTGAPGAFLRAYGPEPATCGRAITGQATEITETTATLNGKVNPSGEALTECRFEYGTTLAYGSEALCAESGAEIGEGAVPVDVHAPIAELSKGTVYHFRLKAGGAGGVEAGSDETFKTLGPPVLSEEGALGVAFTEATLSAQVNPEGFATTYRFEYGTDTNYGQSTAPSPLGADGDRSEHPASAAIEGLSPGTTYHWRILATNKSGTTKGPDQVLTTYVRPTPQACPNDALRSGPSADLPDCRAYEMVSPVDKNGGDILHGLGQAGYVQATPDGAKITYTAPPAFGDVETSVAGNQYLARRDAGAGWSNRGIQPAVVPGSRPVGAIFFGLFREFLAFSEDLCSAWFWDVREPPLTDAGQDGYANLYRLDLCGDEEPEALTDVELPEGTSPGYVNNGNQAVTGSSTDGRSAFFSAQATLTPEAAASGVPQLYVRRDKELHLVSIRPNGTAHPQGGEVGSGTTFNLERAVSEDGSRVYWAAGKQLLLREHPEQGAVEGECDKERTKACSVLVTGGGVLGAFFWAGTADGSAVLYTQGSAEGDNLFVQEFENVPGKSLPESKLEKREVAGKVRGVLGASEDLRRIYFVSTEALAEGAKANEPNLYLDEEGTLTQIATLAGGDVGEGGGLEIRAYDLTSLFPYRRATRVNPDGSRLLFQSRAPLTGVNNTDPATGEALVQVFTYEAPSGKLDCVSCNPSGARARGEELHEPYRSGGGNPTGVFASGWIQTWEHPLHAARALSGDGSRIFFHSHEALLPRDRNGTMDVYEWERAGAGSCEEEDPNYFAKNGGCIYLISSGESGFRSEFWEAAADGSSVFFSTESSLVPQDPGNVDLYVARVGGGFPPPPEPPAECEGEACQSPPPPPPFPAPSSDTYVGPPNPRPGACARQARRAAKLSRLARRARRAARRARRGANRAGAKRLQGKAARNARRARKASRNAKRCRRAARKGANR